MSRRALPPSDLREGFKQTAIEAASVAARVVAQHARTGFRIEHKGVLLNLVTDADRHAEQAIVDVIHAAYPSHQVLAEERGATGSGSPYKWIIDPLDGTTNFAHGFPAYCVSIALEYEEQVILGVVKDATRDELFRAEAGCGAFLNDGRIHVSQVPRLDQALLVTGFSYDIRENPQNNLNHFSQFSLRAQGVRRTGSAALDLCYIAAGRFDGFWELKLNPWDMAAGALMVVEAGGRMSNFKGGLFSIYEGEMVASNGPIHDEMLAVLTPSV
jgi:myo-inositol-1(or 4)-monophosphatase